MRRRNVEAIQSSNVQLKQVEMTRDIGVLDKLEDYKGKLLQKKILKESLSNDDLFEAILELTNILIKEKR